MNIFSVWNEKGGVGKSTLAFNLAGAATAKGLNVVLIDEDHPQHSCLDLAQDGNVSFKVVATEPNIKPDVDFNGVDLIIFDMSPGVEVLPRGNIVMPYQPNRLAFKATVKHFARLNEIGKVVRVMSKVDTRINKHREFALEQRKQGAKQVTYWSVYEHATNEGRTIFDPALNSHNKASKARNEINLIFDEVMNND